MENATLKLAFLAALCAVAFYDSFFIMPMAEARAMSEEITCSNDGVCTQFCDDHRGKCVNGDCICGGGPKQSILEAISPSACVRDGDCTKSCPPECARVRCIIGKCFCQCF